MACPFEIIIQKSALKSLVLSMFIGILYQFLLSNNKEFGNYMTDSYAKRHNLIDYNKEGLFSLIGYLSIYFAGEAVCYRLKHLISER